MNHAAIAAKAILAGQDPVPVPQALLPFALNNNEIMMAKITST
jgi:hypothetical protein